MRVSLPGLASCRSSDVKASISSGAFECPVAPADIDLHQHPCFDQTGNRQICSLERPAGQLGRSAYGQYRCRWKGCYDPSNCGVAPRIAYSLSPSLLQLPHLLLETPGAFNRPAGSTGKQQYPSVDSFVGNFRVGQSDIAGGCKAIHVIIHPCSKHEGNRRKKMRSQAASAHDKMNQSPAQLGRCRL